MRRDWRVEALTWLAYVSLLLAALIAAATALGFAAGLAAAVFDLVTAAL